MCNVQLLTVRFLTQMGKKPPPLSDSVGGGSMSLFVYLCLTLQTVFLDVLIQKDIFVDNKCFASHSPQKSKYRGI